MRSDLSGEVFRSSLGDHRVCDDDDRVRFGMSGENREMLDPFAVVHVRSKIWLRKRKKSPESR